MLSNVLVAEAFLQFFVKIFATLSTKDFSKEKFIESHGDQAVKFFLEWVLETTMFKEFLRTKAEHDKQRGAGEIASSYFEGSGEVGDAQQPAAAEECGAADEELATAEQEEKLQGSNQRLPEQLRHETLAPHLIFSSSHFH